MASQLVIPGAQGPLVGSIPLAGDQDVLLCRMALAAMCRGRSSFQFRSEQAGVTAFCGALEHFGVHCEWSEGSLMMQAGGLFGFEAPTMALDLRGELAVAAYVLALSVSRSFTVELFVDDLIVELLVPVLSQAHRIETSPLPGGGACLVLASRSEEERPEGVEVLTHGVFPWVKQAILLAGVRARSATIVQEKIASADHLERAMTRARLPLTVIGTQITLHPPRDDDALAPQSYESMGSLSLFAPLAAAAMIRAESFLTVREVCLNPTRASFLSLARALGSEVGVSPRGDRQGEPFGDISIRAFLATASGRVTEQKDDTKDNQLIFGGETLLRQSDEVIYSMAAAAFRSGPSLFTDMVAQGRGGSSRIWGRVLGLFASAGIVAEPFEDGIRICGESNRVVKPIQVTTGGDARLALLATILALGASGESVIDDVDCIRGLFPRWVGTLRALGAKIEVREA